MVKFAPREGNMLARDLRESSPTLKQGIEGFEAATIFAHGGSIEKRENAVIIREDGGSKRQSSASTSKIDNMLLYLIIVL